MAENVSVTDVMAVFREPPREFYPTLMWFWNGDIEADEIRRQIRAMDSVDIGSFFIHPMFGFGLDYLSEEHFRLMSVAADEAEKRGMHMHIYDEYNWPSGTSGGRIIRDYPEFRVHTLTAFKRDAKTAPHGSVPHLGELVSISLTSKEGTREIVPVSHGSQNGHPTIEWRLPAESEGTVLVVQEELRAELLPFGMWSPFCWDQEGYVDIMNPAAVRKFIETTYAAYHRDFPGEFGGLIHYVFTDEAAAPIVAVNSIEEPAAIPWFPGLFDLFSKEKEYDVRQRIHELFLDTGDFVKTRLDYWSLVGERIVGSYYGQVSEWCNDRGVKLTGHLLGEENIAQSVMASGDPLCALATFGLPGIDSIFSKRSMHETRASVAPKFAASVAHHRGASKMLCETYTGSGWDLTIEDMKRIFDWQSVLGTTWLMYMGGYYSIAGFRKLPGGCYPPSHLSQRPDWRYYRDFNRYVACVSALNSVGEHRADVAVLFPLSTVRCELNHGTYLSDRLKLVDATFVAVTNALLQIQRDFDYIHESQLTGAEISDGQIRVGKRGYRAVVLPAVSCLSYKCVGKLMDCIGRGVTFLFVNGLPHRSADPIEIQSVLNDVLEVASEHIADSYTLIEAGADKQPVCRSLGAKAFLIAAPVMKDNHSDALRPLLEECLTGVRRMFHFSEPQPNVLTMHRTMPDREQFYIVNRSDEPINTTLTVKRGGTALRLEPAYETVEPLGAVISGEGVAITLAIRPYDAFFVHVVSGQHSERRTATRLHGSELQRVTLSDSWRFRPLGGNLRRLETRILFTDDGALPAADDPRWGTWNVDVLLREYQKDNFRSWKGRPFWAEATFELDDPIETLHVVTESVEPFDLYVNGTISQVTAHEFVWDVSNVIFDISDAAHEGENRLLLRSRFPDWQAPHTPPFVALRGDFQVDRTCALTARGERIIRTGPWADQGYPDFSGTAVYEQTFTLPDEITGADSVTLRMERVATVAEVWLNGERVGSRLWQPYEFKIGEACRAGENQLVVHVTNTLANLFEVPIESGILGSVEICWNTPGA